MHKTLISMTAASLFLAGCANMTETQKNTATGAGVGAVAGALISAATGEKPEVVEQRFQDPAE